MLEMTRAEKDIQECARLHGVLEYMEEAELAEVFNTYCEKMKYYEDRIYPMCDIEMELDAYASNHSLVELVEEFKGFNFNNDYFTYTVFGIESLECVYDKVCDFEIAGYCIENDDDLGSIEIREVLDEFDEVEVID